MNPQTQTAAIEVKYVNPPKDGKQSGTVKATDGQLYGVWPDKLGLFQPGRRYKIEFVERDYKGKTYRSITKGYPEPSPSATPQNNTTSPPRAGLGEEQFVAHMLAASLQSQLVELNDRDLTRAATMFQALYRQLLMRH